MHLREMARGKHESDADDEARSSCYEPAVYYACNGQNINLQMESCIRAEHEAQRLRNQELVKMHEESSMHQEQARRATEEQILAQRHQIEKTGAEIERENIKVKAMAEAEERAHEGKLAEDVNKRMLLERANAEREKWPAVINTTFDHI